MCVQVCACQNVNVAIRLRVCISQRQSCHLRQSVMPSTAYHVGQVYSSVAESLGVVMRGRETSKPAPIEVHLC